LTRGATAWLATDTKRFGGRRRPAGRTLDVTLVMVQM